MFSNITSMAAFNENDDLHVIVETPRNSTVKLAYDPALQLFLGRRALAQGLHYPYDWGFIPGTRGGDGDPVDAMVVYEGATYPGVVLTCTVLDMLRLTQADTEAGQRQENNRIIVGPVWNYSKTVSQETILTDMQRQALEKFFLNATLFTEKSVELNGWVGRAAAIDFIKSSLCAVT